MPDEIEISPESEVVDDVQSDIMSAMESVEADSAPETTASPEASEASEPAGQPRAPDGKFAKKVAEEPGHGASVSEAGAKPVGVATTAPIGQPVVQESKPPVAIRAPQSWKPAAREHWATLPPDVQAEIARREGETSRVLDETTEARRFRESFQQTITPYEAMLRSEGADPMQAMASLLETARQLRSAPPAQRASLVAQIVKGYGVPIDALDAALAGQPYQGSHQQTYQDPRVDQLFAQMEQAKQQRAQQEAQAADDAVEAFGSDKEFFADVREDMADIIELSEKRGQKIDLETAYARALKMNDEISKVMSQREAAKQASTAKAATMKAKAAASSVRSSGPPPKGGPQKATIEDEIRAAMEEEASSTGSAQAPTLVEHGERIRAHSEA